MSSATIQNCNAVLQETWEISDNTTVTNVTIDCEVPTELTCVNLTEGLHLQLTDTHFHCGAGGRGRRGINLNPGSNLTLTNTVISNCSGLSLSDPLSYVKAMGGGAIRALGWNTIVMENVTLGNNSALFGGAIFATENTTLILRNTSIANNVGHMGGGIHMGDSTITFADCKISNNSADQGPGMYTYNSKVFINGTANSAEGIVVGSDSSVDIC